MIATNAEPKSSQGPSAKLTLAGEQRPATAAPVLLRPEELAERLCVPVTWIREKTRERARVRDKDPLPVVRLGKYVRFSWSDVEAWLSRQSI